MNDGPLRMRRKVQQLGTSTLAVTVPADWARHHEIEKGDELVLQRDENGGSLLLVPDEPTRDDAAAAIDADALDADALERAVVTQYVLGRQLVRVESDSGLEPGHVDAVLDAERRLMGLGVVEEAHNHVTVRCSVAPEDFELPTLLRRLGRTEATMREGAIEALATGDDAAARRASGRHDQVEKLFYLFLRLVFATYRNPRLNQAVGLETGFPLIGYRSVAQDVVLMAGAADDVAALVTDGQIEAPDDGAVDHLEDVAAALDQAATATRDAVTAPDCERTAAARDALARVDDRVATANEYLERERPEPLLALQRAIVLLERSARHVRDSLDVATHLAFRDSPELVDVE